MIKRYQAVIVFACFFQVSTSLAIDPGEFDSKKLATDLAECGGLFSAMGKVLENLGHANAAQTYQDTARGAYLSAAFLNHITGNIPNWENALNWSENLNEVNKTYWLGLIEMFTPTVDKVFPDTFMKELEFCTDLNPIQTELVNQMREWIYSQE